MVASPLVPGDMVGRYRLIGPLGGGMSVVFEAEDTVLDRRVALKTLPGDSNTKERRERLLEEARAAARLSHPQVVTVFDVASAGEIDFLVMELLPAGSVADLLKRRGKLPWQMATNIAIQACAGLSAAHAAGLVHRDIKPSNLLIAGQNQASAGGESGEQLDVATFPVKISDFGISRAIRATTTASSTTLVLGTADYMSPEQCEGEAQPQSDLYSLGASWFMLLTGRPPFVADHPLKVMFQHCASPIPDPRALVPELPEGCTAIVRRALAKSPRDRYRSAAELQFDLERLLVGQPIERCDCPSDVQHVVKAIETDVAGSSPAQSAVWRRWPAKLGAAALAAVLLAAMIAAASAWFSKTNANARQMPMVNSSLATPPSGPPDPSALGLAWRPGTRRLHGELQMAAVSPTGRYLACALGAGTALVWDLEEDERTRWLEGPEKGAQVRCVAFTPDSHVVTAFGNLVQVHDIPTGRYERLQQLEGQAASVAVSSGGRYLAVGEDRGEGQHGRVWLHRFQRNDGKWEIEKTHVFENPYRLAIGCVAFSPDGGTLAAFDVRGNICVLEVTSGGHLRTLHMPEPKRQNSVFGHCLEFSPNNRLLAAAGDLRVVLWDMETWEQRILADAHQSPITHLTWSRDGRWLITAGNDGLLVWDNATGLPRSDRPLAAGQEVRTLLFLGRDQWLLSGTADKKLLMWSWREAIAATNPREALLK
ncbi:MAG TPA: serine/threonine-protein kinase [Pirellulaceae bacterium]|nr:serine/threonine-protein kinase [Pirellulaceae bacterium]